MVRAGLCAIFYLFVPWSAAPVQADTTLLFEYGQSPRVWGILKDVKGANHNLSRINSILNENFGNYETAFARLGTAFDLVSGKGGGWPERVRMSLEAQGAALGLVENPVLPELEAAAIAAGLVRLAWLGHIQREIFLETALVGGYGIERRLNAVSTDLIETVPFQKRNVVLAGADLRARRYWRFDLLDLTLTAQDRETYYWGLNGKSSVALDRPLRAFTHDWLGRVDLAHSFWNVHGLMGVHPFPSDVLPRVWDRVANTHAWREWGAMAGAGAGASWGISKGATLAALGGFYSGYLGGEIRLRFQNSGEFRLSSFKVENSSAYHTLGRRIYALNAQIPL